ncbi:RNA-binding protein 39-like [Zingiber officinale]|uniref:RNA-binding protein 39-like n=1 Tax=Zingiber officinale TaxID=94328 RepID=UPI001C4C0614|nr:RNA-binding protein 39-like [Zingiber officinale]
MSVPLAIALSGQHLLGQPVMIKPSEAEKNLVQSTATDAGVAGAAERKIYVGNLHYNITEEQLRQIFEPFGTMDLVQLPLDETGQCRGYGFIQFAQLEHAKAAQSLNGKLDIAGCIIKNGIKETGTTAVDFDDEDGGGLIMRNCVETVRATDRSQILDDDHAFWMTLMGCKDEGHLGCLFSNGRNN